VSQQQSLNYHYYVVFRAAVDEFEAGEDETLEVLGSRLGRVREAWRKRGRLAGEIDGDGGERVWKVGRLIGSKAA
jgi:hypothetical protein